MVNKKKLALLLAGAMLGSSAVAYAAETDKVAGGGDSTATVKQDSAQLDEYQLDDVVVTATRTEKREVDVPAAMEVMTAEDIKESGAYNALEAVGKMNGITFKTFGALGANMGAMSNDAAIRGVDNGTLVLVNGNPVAWRGKYNLEAIPADSIERIEIVKGNGSVLYGSDAAAGVINIITKKKADNSVTVGFGNMGRQKYALNAGTDDVQIHFNLDKLNESNHVTETDVTKSKTNKTVVGETKTDILDIENGSFGLNWNINPYLTFVYNHTATDSTYDRWVIGKEASAGPSYIFNVGDHFKYLDYKIKQDTYQLNYEHKNFKAQMYFNDENGETSGYKYFTDYGESGASEYFTKERNQSYGIDIQNKWQVGEKTNFLAGLDWKHEKYQNLPDHDTDSYSIGTYNRNIWGIFGQWEQQYDAKNSTILGLRETFTTGADKDKNYSNLSGSLQYLHKMDKDNNLYASVAQSFIMPTFSDMFKNDSKHEANPDLKPQKGITYEIGWKNNHGAHTWRAAVFHTDIKDNISATSIKGASGFKYTNEDFRDTGIEISCDIDTGKQWSFNYGLTWHNPQSKQSGQDVNKPYWDSKFGRLQLTTGIGYHWKKFKANLSASYLAYRVQSQTSEPNTDVKPYLLTSLVATYSPTDKTDFSLSVDNLLDRNDITTHSSSAYYATPINFLFSITQHF